MGSEKANPEWFEKIQKRCIELQAEVFAYRKPGEDFQRIKFIFPKMPSDQDKELINEAIPKDLVPEFEEGPRNATLGSLELIAGIQGMDGSLEDFDIIREHPHYVKVVLKGKEELQDSRFCAVLVKVLNDEPYIREWDIVLNDEKIFSKNEIADKVMAEKEVRPDRGVISSDDILNVKIALGSAETVEDFLKSIGG
jgi:hypothetical protein